MEAPVQPVTMEAKLTLPFLWNVALIPTEIHFPCQQPVPHQRISEEAHAQQQHRRELLHWFGVRNQV